MKQLQTTKWSPKGHTISGGGGHGRVFFEEKRKIFTHSTRRKIMKKKIVQLMSTKNNNMTHPTRYKEKHRNVNKTKWIYNGSPLNM